MAEAKYFYVSGRVQGVYYRASTQQQAASQGLTGWVRNLHDGRVEVLACGEPASLDNLEKWLWRGPEGALVDDVIAAPAEVEDVAGYSDFQVKR